MHALMKIHIIETYPIPDPFERAAIEVSTSFDQRTLPVSVASVITGLGRVVETNKIMTPTEKK